METENFAFLPPITMLVFGAAFLLVWRYGSPSALWLGGGFLGHAAAFTGELVFASFPDALRTLAVDALFIASYFSFAQALAIHFRQPRQIVGHAVFCVVAYAAIAYAILVADSLRLELLSVDVACALLILLPLRGMRRLPARTTDRVFVVIVVLTALDFMLRSLVFALTASPEVGFADYMTSGYAFAAQISGALLGLVFALAALGAVTLDVIDGYRKEAETDPLTELLNRRGFENAVCAPDGRIEAGMVVVCDIDHFKRINDEFGHATGDRVIAGLAGVLRRNLPEGAAAARFGGEEFVVLMPETPLRAAMEVAERIREAVAETKVPWAQDMIPLSVSIGVSCCPSTAAEPGELIATADAALYRAKAEGRNRTVAAASV